MSPQRALLHCRFALRRRPANRAIAPRLPPKRRLALERLEDRSVLADGYIDWGVFAAPADSFEPAYPITSDAISFTLYEEHITGDPCGASFVHGGWPSLDFDLASKVIDVVFLPDDGTFCGADWEPIQGLQGTLWGLDAGDWTLNGPHSSIQFTVTGEPVPHLTISDATIDEGDTGTASAVFTLVLTVPSDQMVTVDFATADGLATASDGDYVPAAGTVTFAPGETMQTVAVAVSGDLRDEYDETFALNLSNQVNTSVPDTQGVAFLRDNDSPPALTIGDVSLAEGSGAAAFEFAIHLSAASGKTVRVNYATADGTATAASGDYQPKTGTLTFHPGETSKTIAVPVLGDAVQESDETFVVNLSNPTSATIADGQAVGTIRNDDARSLSINDVFEVEGQLGTKTFVFTVQLTSPSSQTVSVHYATANGTARSGADYRAKSGTLVFAPGQTSKTIPIVVNGDRTAESDETFFVNLTGAAGAAILDGQGLGTIVNDERRIPLSSAAALQAFASDAWLSELLDLGRAGRRRHGTG